METGFDPQALNDNYAYMVCDAIYDALYTYDYFARPPRNIPNTAAGMPQIGIGEHSYGNVLAQPWLKGFKPDPLLRYQWKVYDVAPR